MNSIGEFATNAGRRPDWWLQAAADAMRTAHELILGGSDAGEIWEWLADRIAYLLYLGEHSTSGNEAA